MQCDFFIVFVLTFVSLRDQLNRRLLHSQLNSYLLCMSYSDCEVWAGDITGKLHSFSMRDGTLKAMSQIDVGHTALITGIHRSPGSLYTCSSDRTVKVLFGTFFFFFTCTLLHYWMFFQLVATDCVPGTPPVRASKDIVHTAAPRCSPWGQYRRTFSYYFKC